VAKKICIYLLAVLFIGSVAGVQATPRKYKEKPKKVHKWDFSKFEKFNSKSFHKYDLKKKSSASFLKKINKFDSKIFKRENKKGYKALLSKKFEHISWNNGPLKNGLRCPPKNGNPVPEPSSMLLLGFGLIGLAGWGRKKLKKIANPL